MKLTVAHVLALIVAVALLDVGQTYMNALASKAGAIVLALTVLLLIADIAMACVESFREADQDTCNPHSK